MWRNGLKFSLISLIVIISFSVTFFVRNLCDYYRFSECESSLVYRDGLYHFVTYKNNDVVISFNDNSMEIRNAGYYCRKERIQTLICVERSMKECGYLINRSVLSLEAEWALHGNLYEFDIAPDYTRNANLDYCRDPRWYVQLGTILYQILGI
jgi:hypothetical protein